MMSQRGKNKKVAHEPPGRLMFLPRCDVVCASITEQTTGKWNLFVLYNKYIKKRHFKRFTEFSWGNFGALKKMNASADVIHDL